MSISSVIVEVEQGAETTVLGEIARVPHTSVFGFKDSQIVTVIEGRDNTSIRQTVESILSLSRVIAVYPVYAGEE